MVRLPMPGRLVLVFVLPVTLVCRAVTAEEDHAPLPERLVTAKSAYLVNDSGDLKAYDNFYKELRKWNRFLVVPSRGDADVVMVLTSNSQYAISVVTATATGGNVIGTAVSVPSTSLCLKIFDPATAETLWSDMTEKWITSGHAPSKLVSNLRKRLPAVKPVAR
jgi:hypothetical protein